MKDNTQPKTQKYSFFRTSDYSKTLGFKYSGYNGALPPEVIRVEGVGPIDALSRNYPHFIWEIEGRFYAGKQFFWNPYLFEQELRIIVVYR